MRREEYTQSLLQIWNAGETDGRDKLIARIYPELRQVAAARLRFEQNCSLSVGDIVSEAVLKIMKMEDADIKNRAHLMALAARMMRHVLIDHIRAKNFEKRRHRKVELTTNLDGEMSFDLLSLETALVRLDAINPNLMELVEMRFFGGMTIAETSEATGLSEPTVKRRWQVARAWLADALDNPIGDV